MYQDEILLLIGAVATGLIVLLAMYLLASRKKAKLYREILGAETTAIETLTTALNTTDAVTTLNFKVTDQEFDPEVLRGQYEIEAEITGGGMSRVFIAKKTNIGNDWIVKYVPSAIGQLTNEADILKSLNHISLPKIIDIFDDDSGLYIVQSYVEGMGLNQILKSSGTLHEFMLLDFAKQLAQVLKYLHERGPILHLDLKPSNIMVTHDSKLVLIDFGISKKQDVYILTSPWQDDGDFFYGIIRLRGDEAEGFFLGSALGTQVRDFYVHDGKIYFLEQSSGVTHLRTINVHDADDIRTVVQLPETISALAIGGGEVFFADDALGVILAYRFGELVHVAGAVGERGFVDGADPSFYRPTRIRYQDNALYVWDFNVLRRVQLVDGIAYDTTTVAGIPSMDYGMEFYEEEPAWQIVFPFSYLTDFIHVEDGILITDPVRGVIWKVG